MSPPLTVPCSRRDRSSPRDERSATDLPPAGASRRSVGAGDVAYGTGTLQTNGGIVRVVDGVERYADECARLLHSAAYARLWARISRGYSVSGLRSE
jgi:hypothetical protein